MNLTERERLQKKAMILSIAYLLSMTMNCFIMLKKLREEVENIGGIEAIFGETVIYLDDLSDLDEILGKESISEEKLYKVIDENHDMPESYKEAAKKIVLHHINEDPNYDFRIFYDNLKTLKVSELDEEEFKKQVLKSYGTIAYPAAFYESKTNTIYSLKDTYQATKTHELEHVANSWYRVINNKTYRYSPTFFREENGRIDVLGTSISEAYDNEAIKDINISNSYHSEKAVLEFLKKYCDYDYIDYHEYGIQGLIEQFKDEDRQLIKEIIDELDKLHAKNLKSNKSLETTEYQVLFDKCFALATRNINILNPYQGFINFYELLYNKAKYDGRDYCKPACKKALEYLDKYNEILQKNGFKNIITKEELEEVYETYKDIDCWYIIDNTIYPGDFIQKYYIDLEGKRQKTRGIYEMIPETYFLGYLIPHYLRYNDLAKNPYFWYILVDSNELIQPRLYKKIPLYLNGRLITTAHLSNLYIKVGQDKKDNFTFTIIDKDEKPIIKSEDDIRQTKYISFLSYLKEFDFYDKINLEEVLNEDYLTNFNHINRHYFPNLEYDEDTNRATIEPTYYISVKIGNAIASSELNDIAIYDIGDLYIYIDWYTLVIPLEGQVYKIIRLIDILKYFNIFNNEQIEYTFTEEELTSLILTYFTENKDLIDEDYIEYIYPVLG